MLDFTIKSLRTIKKEKEQKQALQANESSAGSNQAPATNTALRPTKLLRPTFHGKTAKTNTKPNQPARLAIEPKPSANAAPGKTLNMMQLLQEKIAKEREVQNQQKQETSAPASKIPSIMVKNAGGMNRSQDRQTDANKRDVNRTIEMRMKELEEEKKKLAEEQAKKAALQRQYQAQSKPPAIQKSPTTQGTNVETASQKSSAPMKVLNSTPPAASVVQDVRPAQRSGVLTKEQRLRMLKRFQASKVR